MAFDIDPSLCRHRQQRLQAEMRRHNLDLVIVARTEHVQWLTGPRFGWVYEPLAALWKDGSCTLVAPNEPPKVHAADAVVTYEAQWLCTLRNDQRYAAVVVSHGALDPYGVILVTAETVNRKKLRGKWIGCRL